jgi:hypothetical protein
MQWLLKVDDNLASVGEGQRHHTAYALVVHIDISLLIEDITGKFNCTQSHFGPIQKFTVSHCTSVASNKRFNPIGFHSSDGDDMDSSELHHLVCQGIDPTAYAQLTRSIETIDTERPLHLLVAVSGWLWAKRPVVHPLNSPRDTIYAGDSPLTRHKPA